MCVSVCMCKCVCVSKNITEPRYIQLTVNKSTGVVIFSKWVALHMVATNLCVWFRTIVTESEHSIHDLEEIYHLLSHNESHGIDANHSLSTTVPMATTGRSIGIVRSGQLANGFGPEPQGVLSTEKPPSATKPHMLQSGVVLRK